MGLIRGVVFFVLLVVGIGFAVQNDQPVSLKYYFGWASPPLPLFLWAFLFLLLGLVLSAVWAFISRVGLHSRIRTHRKSIADLERERDRLREEERTPQGGHPQPGSWIGQFFGKGKKEGKGEKALPPPQ